MPASEVFGKWKAGKLHSGSKSGPPVKSHAQAIAIYLSEKRKEAQHGGKYPEKQMGGPVGMGMPPPGMGGMMPGVGGLPPSMPPSSMSPGLPGFRAEGGGVDDDNPFFPITKSPVLQVDPMASGMLQRGASPTQTVIPPSSPNVAKAINRASAWMQEKMQAGLGDQPALRNNIGIMMRGGPTAEAIAKHTLSTFAPHPSEALPPPTIEGEADGGAVSDADRRRGYRDLASQMSMDRAARNLGPTIQSTDANVAQGISDVVPRGLGDGFQFGGSPTSMGLTPGWIERSEARNIGAMSRPHLGPIVSTVGGRTDNHAISVPSGSYVFPAAHVSAIGQGNTLNGLKVLQGMFGPPMRGGGGGRLPMGRPAPMLKPMAGGMPKGAPFASSGRAPFTSAGGSRGDAHIGKPVDIMAAGGEFVLSPDQVMEVGSGHQWSNYMSPAYRQRALDHGHRILDHWVKKKHKEWGKTVTNLPPPAKS